MRRMIGVITALMMSQAAATAEPQQIDLDVPSTTVAATVQINVKPPKGAVLLYTGPSYDKPIRFQARGCTTAEAPLKTLVPWGTPRVRAALALQPAEGTNGRSPIFQPTASKDQSTLGPRH
jgi:hypothetical protein